MVYFRGILIGTMRRIRNTRERGERRPPTRFFRSNEDILERKGHLKRKRNFLSNWKGKNCLNDSNRLLVEDERVRGSPEHVTIIPSRGWIYVHVQDPNGWCARQSGTRDRLTQRSPSIVTRTDNAVY